MTQIHPSRLERPALIAEVLQLREQAARTAPVVEAAVALRVAEKRSRDEARIDAATAELCDAVDELFVGTIAHAVAVKAGVAE